MVAAVAGIEIRARKTELGSSCCGYSAGSTPLVANGAVTAGPDAAARMFCCKAWSTALVTPPVGGAPSASQGSSGSLGFLSVLSTSCMAKESTSLLAEKGSVAS